MWEWSRSGRVNQHTHKPCYSWITHLTAVYAIMNGTLPLWASLSGVHSNRKPWDENKRISVNRAWKTECQDKFIRVEFSCRLDNEASFLSLLKVELCGARCASVPPPTLAISSQRWRIHSASGRQKGWTCSRWMSAQWQHRKLWINSESGFFVRMSSKQDHLTEGVHIDNNID